MRRLSGGVLAGVALAGLAMAVALLAAPPVAVAADTPNPHADLKAFQ